MSTLWGDSMPELCLQLLVFLSSGLLLYRPSCGRVDIPACFPAGGFCESGPSMSPSAPAQRPVSGGQTCRLMGCVNHSDILQTPVLKRCHTLAVIVMGGSGWLNQQAGDLYYAPQYVR